LKGRAYSEFDDVPCSVNPVLYKALDDWGFDGELKNAIKYKWLRADLSKGYITADDTG
jgi:hypothetical protein